MKGEGARPIAGTCWRGPCCESRFTGAGEPSGGPSNAHRFREYVTAAMLVDGNEGARAVPHLTGILSGTL